MATLKELIEYSKANPTSEIASKTKTAIEAGAYDQEAMQSGIDLSWAGRPTQAPTPTKAPLKERVADVLVKQAGKQAETIQRQKAGGQTFVETGVQELGQGLATAGGVAFETLRSIPGLGNLIDKGVETLGEGVRPIVESEKAQKAIQAYQNLDPRLKADLEGIFEIAGAIVTPGAGKAGAKGALKGTEMALKGATEGSQAVVSNLAERSVKRGISQATEATKKVIQGDTKDIARGLRVLSQVDRKGVETYKDLSGAINKSITRTKEAVDQIYQSVEGQRVLKDLGIEDVVELGGAKKKVRINYVEDALNQLDELYGSIKQPKDQARIQLIRQKAEIEGLTPFEINELAREYGTEFGDKAFSKRTGEALTSTNSQGYESTRKGIKDTARGFLPDDEAKKLDLEMSDMIEVKRLTDTMAEKVNKLEARIEPRGKVETAFRALAKVADVATLGGPKAFIQKLFFPSNVGLKTLNSLDLQNQLKRNLKIIQDLVDTPDETLPGKILQYMKEPKLGASIEDVSKNTGEAFESSKNKIPFEVSKDIKKAFKDSKKKGSPTMGKIAPYKGEKDLTTKILKDLEGKTTVSKQYILDATNRGELKQVERDITRQVLDTMPDGQINVKEFADKVKSELLPLKRSFPSAQEGGTNQYARYENIALPEDLRGNVKNYNEVIYQSPIETSAGSVHFGREKNYFGHTRIEQMADDYMPGKKVSRVIEVQTDLYQKGRLEQELISDTARRTAEKYGLSTDPEYLSRFKDIKPLIEARRPEIAKLRQYNDPTAHFRMIREELKKAAQNGDTHQLYPTGETAMKIEGLGDNTQWYKSLGRDGDYNIDMTRSQLLTANDLKVGAEVNQSGNSAWIITDVLGDGKFKAVPKENYVINQEWSYLNADGNYLAVNSITDDVQQFETASAAKKFIKETKESVDGSEQFDISGKVDTNNPIYKFYEKEMQKYLSKFGGKKVVDDKGVEWIEVPIKKEWAKMPVEAFALLGGVGLASQMKNK